MRTDEQRAKDRAYWQKTRERRCELQRERYRNNKEKFYQINRNSVLKRKYGISLEEYYELHESQEGLCAICAEHEPSGKLLAVDHNHSTGEVRALLCGSCNRALGLFQDSKELIERAAAYLELHGGSD